MLAERKRLLSWKISVWRNVSELTEVFARIKQIAGQEHIYLLQTRICSMVYAVKPGDGSAREQAGELPACDSRRSGEDRRRVRD
ncbi:hypothetical protein ACNKHX_05545 [Shigella flexneri]